MLQNAKAGGSTQTVKKILRKSKSKKKQLVLKLKPQDGGEEEKKVEVKAPARNVTWTEDTIDNEFMGKKKSKSKTKDT